MRNLPYSIASSFLNSLNFLWFFFQYFISYYFCAIACYFKYVFAAAAARIFIAFSFAGNSYLCAYKINYAYAERAHNFLELCTELEVRVE